MLAWPVGLDITLAVFDFCLHPSLRIKCAPSESASSQFYENSNFNIFKIIVHLLLSYIKTTLTQKARHEKVKFYIKVRIL